MGNPIPAQSSRRRAGLRLLSLTLLFALLIGALPASGIRLPAARPVQALEDRTDEFESGIQQAKERIAQTRREMKEIEAEVSAWKDKLSALQLENQALEKERETLLHQIEEAEQTLLQRQKEQAEAEQDVLRKQQEYQKRVSAMFYFRQRSTWEILLSSKGLEGFFTNIRMITAISASDARMLRDLRHAEEIKQAATEIATKTRDEFKTFLAEKEVQLAELEKGISLALSEQDRLSTLLSNRSMEMADEEADLAQKEAAFAAYKAALQNYSGAIAQLTPAGSGAVWPLPASQTVTSPYGYRSLGFDRSNGFMHTGTDFAGPNVAGSPVVAAWEGVVVTVNQPYPGQMYAPQANFVQISHGGGLGTGYWHLMSTAVVPGQHVAQGQVIGYCGSTGMSTGPHLHFEVYNENGGGVRNTVDPMLYLGG